METNILLGARKVASKTTTSGYQRIRAIHEIVKYLETNPVVPYDEFEMILGLLTTPFSFPNKDVHKECIRVLGLLGSFYPEKFVFWVLQRYGRTKAPLEENVGLISAIPGFLKHSKARKRQEPVEFQVRFQSAIQLLIQQLRLWFDLTTEEVLVVPMIQLTAFAATNFTDLLSVEFPAITDRLVGWALNDSTSNRTRYDILDTFFTFGTLWSEHMVFSMRLLNAFSSDICASGKNSSVLLECFLAVGYTMPALVLPTSKVSTTESLLGRVIKALKNVPLLGRSIVVLAQIAADFAKNYTEQFTPLGVLTIRLLVSQATEQVVRYQQLYQVLRYTRRLLTSIGSNFDVQDLVYLNGLNTPGQLVELQLNRHLTQALVDFYADLIRLGGPRLVTITVDRIKSCQSQPSLLVFYLLCLQRNMGFCDDLSKPCLASNDPICCFAFLKCMAAPNVDVLRHCMTLGSTKLTLLALEYDAMHDIPTLSSLVLNQVDVSIRSQALERLRQRIESRPDPTHMVVVIEAALTALFDSNRSIQSKAYNVLARVGPGSGNLDFSSLVPRTQLYSSQICTRGHTLKDLVENKVLIDDMMSSNRFTDYFVIWEIAKSCIDSRLKTHFGGAAATFLNLEKVVQESPRDSPKLVEFLSLLFKLIQTTDVAFFQTNQKVCEDWIARMRPSLIDFGSHSRASAFVITHSTGRISEIQKKMSRLACNYPETREIDRTAVYDEMNQYLTELDHVLFRLCTSLVDLKETDVIQGYCVYSTSLLSQVHVRIPFRDSTLRGRYSKQQIRWMNGMFHESQGRLEDALRDYKDALDENDFFSSVSKTGVMNRMIDLYIALDQWKELEKFAQSTDDMKLRLNRSLLHALATGDIGTSLPEPETLDEIIWTSLIEKKKPRKMPEFVQLHFETRLILAAELSQVQALHVLNHDIDPRILNPVDDLRIQTRQLCVSKARTGFYPQNLLQQAVKIAYESGNYQYCKRFLSHVDPQAYQNELPQYLYQTGEKERAIEWLKNQIEEEECIEMTRIVQLAEWEGSPDIGKYLERGLDHSPESSAGWLAYGNWCYQQDKIEPEAIASYFKYLHATSDTKPMVVLLRLLNLLISNENCAELVEEGLKRTRLGPWRHILPQLIAHVDRNATIGGFVKRLGIEFPQQVFYPLMARDDDDILRELQHEYPELVASMTIFVQELRRISFLVDEQYKKDKRSIEHRIAETPFEERFLQKQEMKCKSRLELSDVSPRLASMRNEKSFLIPGAPNVVYDSCLEKIQILPTKSRPKVLKFLGKDGHVYKYILKGNEDLHLDEKIMQLLSSFNSVSKDQDGGSTYRVIPLSKSAGLIQMVPNVMPLFELYKAKHSTPPIQLFHQTLESIMSESTEEQQHPSNEILYQVYLKLTSQDQKETLLLDKLYCTSWSSMEYWMKSNRLVRSMAIMSSFGYFIGLGDRHLDNILLNLETGALIHIDYTICFEKGQRLKVPELVPFRLTNLLMNALGITGVEGQFKTTFDSSLQVLQQEKELFLSLLQAVVFDPVSHWRQETNRQDENLYGLKVLERMKEKLANFDATTSQTLIQSATDGHILSRMYEGWTPWI